ncbi:MAG: HlyD family efflux transporter periplasmic adaptor subunit [Acutalibacteraceae bacterium]|nr:HlyD family efflux transporter periplasmic adaptor subunit [Acutalibacteraceae bacterium]
MLKNKKLVNAVCIAAIVAVMVYLFQDVFKTNNSEYETEIVDEVTVQDTVNLNAFIVRDEQYIDGKADGTFVPLVADGDRVASGDSVVRICTKEQDAADFAELEESLKIRDRYIQLSEQTELDALDMQKLNKDIDDAYTAFLKTINSRSYASLGDNVNRLEDSLASKQVLKDGTIDIDSKIEALDKRIAELEAKDISTENVAAPISGYYISNIDGYEGAVDYDLLSEITIADVDKALNYTPKTVNGKIGKIVGSYKWYILANIESKYSKLLEEGDSLKVNIPEYGYKDVTVIVEHLSPEKDGMIAIALSCNVMNETYANMRVESVELVVDEYTGYKVKTSAIHTYDPAKETTTGSSTETTTTTQTSKPEIMTVVYILRGTVMNARRVEVIYTDGDYSIVRSDSSSFQGIKPVQRYDEVIVKGRDLKNGRSVG